MTQIQVGTLAKIRGGVNVATRNATDTDGRSLRMQEATMSRNWFDGFVLESSGLIGWRFVEERKAFFRRKCCFVSSGVCENFVRVEKIDQICMS